MKKFTPCTKCNEGYLYVSIKDNTYKLAKKCECRVQWEENVRIESRASKAHIRPTFFASEEKYNPLKNYKGKKSIGNVTKLMRYVEEYESSFNHQSLYLFGPHSTQKTTLAQWVGIDLIARYNLKIQYILMHTLIDLLMAQGWEDKEARLLSEGYSLKDIQQADVLIIDEAFDKNKIVIYKSSYQIPFLDQFLRNRIDVLEKPIIFVSNKSPDHIVKEFPALIDLSHLIDRKITKKGAALKFEDCYTDIQNDFQIEDIFAT